LGLGAEGKGLGAWGREQGAWGVVLFIILPVCLSAHPVSPGFPPGRTD